MHRHYWTDGLTWACNLGMFVFGIALAILGVLLPVLFERVELDPAQAGSLFLFLNLGALLVTVISGPVFDRFGFKGMMIVFAILAGTSFIGFAYAGRYATLATSSFLLGLGGGGLNAGTNAMVADLYPTERAAALTRLGVFFGFGTLFIPLLIGFLLDVLSLKGILLITGAVGLLPGVLFLMFEFPPAKHTGGFPVAQALALLRHPVVLLLGVLLFFQSGNEITSSGWMTTFLVQKILVTPAQASLYLAGFWAALILGRLVSSLALRRLSESTVVQASALAAFFSVLAFVLFPHPVLSAVWACLIGFSMAAIFPSVLGQASARFPELSGTLIGALIAIALVGGMLIPWIAGLLVGSGMLSGALLLPAFGFFAVFLLQTVVRGVRSG
ncbi:MAG: MFS transporter, partial [Acidobacteriota bacterium]